MSAETLSVPESSEVPFINVIDPEFRFDLPEVVRAQAAGWYAETPLGMLVLRHAEASELVRDGRLTHNGTGFMEQNGISGGPVYDWFVNGLVNQDGDSHRRLRGLVGRAFTPRMLENLRPVIRQAAERLADEIAVKEEVDFFEAFADALPLTVMSELLGVPAEDYPRFSNWSSEIGLVFSLALGGDIPGRVEAAVVGLYAYVDALMAAKAEAPTDDLVSALVTAQKEDVDGNRVSLEELRNLVVTMVFAAHDTTRLQLANAMVTFSEHPDQWALLRERPELAPRAVEEVMRWRPSSNAVYRYAAEDIEFRGQRIPEGTMFMIGVQAVQRDPLAYPGGDVFDVTAERKTAVMQFGGGPHYCLGAPLARMEITEALPALARRLGAPKVVGDVTWRPAIGITGPNELQLRFG
ncbi:MULTISPECIES: cytochrome P450 [unclassified Streptomyces]|uniref:cytochrome P450 n=1 Tax=unclassified Streptomyces TaxID=2593676 RepID=UPI0006AF06C0|nr:MULTISPECIES: cytochrome P450 [unclassified Streptomyces]KOX15664.1 cytochrome P450 [Streptomyces sp. NRRL F-6491]KOX35700.1 cytochrome P450 [Streptomyces sp. NRRL F-6492]